MIERGITAVGQHKHGTLKQLTGAQHKPLMPVPMSALVLFQRDGMLELGDLK